MGRYSTGAWTTGESLRIELSFLIKQKYFVRGEDVVRSLNWTRNGKPSSSIMVVSLWSEEDTPMLNLIYTTTNRNTGEVEPRNDRIYLEAVPSNLGKGEVLYFICPESGERCRILYKAYNSRIWKSRGAYRNRLYYECQKTSKLDSFNSRYWELDHQLKKLYQRRVVNTYRGKPTRRAERIWRMEQEKYRLDALRWSPQAMTLGLRRAIFDAEGKVKPAL